MPKPKKGEIYGTFNNDMCFERAMEKLGKIENIDFKPLDSHTIKVNLKKRNEDLENAVEFAIESSQGYVETDLDTINALKVPKEKKGDSGVLDTPFYG